MKRAVWLLVVLLLVGTVSAQTAIGGLATAFEALGVNELGQLYNSFDLFIDFILVLLFFVFLTQAIGKKVSKNIGTKPFIILGIMLAIGFMLFEYNTGFRLLRELGLIGVIIFLVVGTVLLHNWLKGMLGKEFSVATSYFIGYLVVVFGLRFMGIRPDQWAAPLNYVYSFATLFAVPAAILSMLSIISFLRGKRSVGKTFGIGETKDLDNALKKTNDYMSFSRAKQWGKNGVNAAKAGHKNLVDRRDERVDRNTQQAKQIKDQIKDKTRQIISRLSRDANDIQNNTKSTQQLDYYLGQVITRMTELVNLAASIVSDRYKLAEQRKRDMVTPKYGMKYDEKTQIIEHFRETVRRFQAQAAEFKKVLNTVITTHIPLAIQKEISIIQALKVEGNSIADIKKLLNGIRDPTLMDKTNAKLNKLYTEIRDAEFDLVKSEKKLSELMTKLKDKLQDKLGEIETFNHDASRRSMAKLSSLKVLQEELKQISTELQLINKIKDDLLVNLKEAYTLTK